MTCQHVKAEMPENIVKTPYFQTKDSVNVPLDVTIFLSLYPTDDMLNKSRIEKRVSVATFNLTAAICNCISIRAMPFHLSESV